MINGVNAGIIISIVILETLSQYLARSFYGSGKDNGKLWYMFLALLIYAPILYLLILTYSYSQFAISNAFWDSGTIIFTSVVGYIAFGETFIWQELLGLGLVVTGAILLGIYSEDLSKK